MIGPDRFLCGRQMFVKMTRVGNEAGRDECFSRPNIRIMTGTCRNMKEIHLPKSVLCSHNVHIPGMARVGYR